MISNTIGTHRIHRAACCRKVPIYIVSLQFTHAQRDTHTQPTNHFASFVLTCTHKK